MWATAAKNFATTFLTLSLASCHGLAPVQLVKSPDSPMLIEGGKGAAKVAVYDRTTNSLVEYGWIDLETLQGWTISKYDWSSYVQKQRRAAPTTNP